MCIIEGYSKAGQVRREFSFNLSIIKIMSPVETISMYTMYTMANNTMKMNLTVCLIPVTDVIGLKKLVATEIVALDYGA